MRPISLMLMVLPLLAPLQAATAQEQTSADADRAQLRQIMDSLKKSVNNGRYDDIGKVFGASFTATMLTQEVVETPSQLADYFKKWMTGKNAVIRKMTVNPVVEGKTRIIDGRFAIAHGRDREVYEMATGQTYKMTSRWTAALVKEDGQWKVAAFHSGVNFLDNPVLAAAGKSSLYMGLAGLVAGLLAGASGMYFWRRKRAGKPA